jgi:hypothetical protein
MRYWIKEKVMSVFQVEQYYIMIENAASKQGEVEAILQDNFVSDYEFESDGTLIADGFELESDAENVCSQIEDLLN